MPCVALTATATPPVLQDLQARLRLHGAATHRTSFDRPNLHYSLRFKDLSRDPRAELCQDVTARLAAGPGVGLVFCHTRAATEELAALLARRGAAATFYHAGLGAAARTSVAERWGRGEVRVVVATIAFGMGIDKVRACARVPALGAAVEAAQAWVFSFQLSLASVCPGSGSGFLLDTNASPVLCMPAMPHSRRTCGSSFTGTYQKRSLVSIRREESRRRFKPH